MVLVAAAVAVHQLKKGRLARIGRGIVVALDPEIGRQLLDRDKPGLDFLLLRFQRLGQDRFGPGAGLHVEPLGHRQDLESAGRDRPDQRSRPGNG